MLWLNSGNDDTFPSGLIEALTLHNNGAMPFEEDPTETVQSRMRKQMQADALQPLKNDDEESSDTATTVGLQQASSGPPEFMDHLEEATQFLCLQVRSNCVRRMFPFVLTSWPFHFRIHHKGSGSASTCVGLPSR